jgi:hypothetical protein
MGPPCCLEVLNYVGVEEEWRKRKKVKGFGKADK